MQTIPYEQASLLQLIKTDNKVLNKIVTVFAALNCEIEFLINEGERKYFYGLLMYGEGPEASKETGVNLTQMGRYISFLQEMSCFTKRCYEVVKSSLMQLSAVYSMQKASFKIETTDMHLKQAFAGVGHLLRILITLDSIVDQHPKLKDDWNAYKRMIKNIHHNPVKFQVDVNKFYRYEKHLVELEGKLLDGCIFQNCVEQLFDSKENMISKNTSLSVEFLQCIRLIIEEIEPQINENSCLETRNKFVSVCAMSVLYNQIYRIFDKKVFKLIWETYKKVGIFFIDNFKNKETLLHFLSLKTRFLSSSQQVPLHGLAMIFFQLSCRLQHECSIEIPNKRIQQRSRVIFRLELKICRKYFNK